MPRRKSAPERLQSAIEYLITYGWAIMIVAVVLYVLFYLGVFNNFQYLPLVCTGAPGFLCGPNPSMSSSGALTISFGYTGSDQITITGLGCNVTPSTNLPSVETTYIPVALGSRINLTFQCPITERAPIGTTIPVELWIYYSTPSLPGLARLYAKGIVSVDYGSILWTVTEWTPSSNSVNVLPYSSLTSNPEDPAGTVKSGSTSWSSFIENGKEGWSYSTDYHNHDTYYGVQTALFPAAPLNLDTAPCNAPYDSHGYTAIAYARMGGNYNFTTMTDDGTEIFYRVVGSGTWCSVFSGNAWQPQPPTAYTQFLNIPQGNYEIVVDYTDSCDPAGLSVVLITPKPVPA